jgi:tetratricopeptide (TPR) repeat protein
MDSRLADLRQRKAAGEHAAVLRLVEEILVAPGELSPPELIEATRAGGTAAMALRRIDAARVCADAEREIANSTGDSRLQAVAAFHQGTAAMEADDLHIAREALEEFDRLDDGGPDLARYRGALWFNLGTVRMRRRDLLGAGEAFRRAREAFLELGQLGNVIRTLLQIAWAELLGRRPEPAGAYLGQCQELLAEHPDEALLTTLLCHRAFYHWTVGEVHVALEICGEVLLTGRQATSADQRQEAAWIAGECRLKLGELDEALRLADLALQLAMSERWAEGMNRAGNLRARVLQAKNESA